MVRICCKCGSPPETFSNPEGVGGKLEQRPTRQWHRGKGVLEPSGSVLRCKNKGSNMQRASYLEPIAPLSLPRGAPCSADNNNGNTNNNSNSNNNNSNTAAAATTTTAAATATTTTTTTSEVVVVVVVVVVVLVVVVVVVAMR